MSKIDVSLVKELRERTGVGMMECKKVLEETGGDIEAAITSLRKNSGLKAAKKAGRTAADGLVAASSTDGSGVMIEVNCETDFVARDDSFIAFTNQLLEAAAATDGDETTLLEGTLGEARDQLVQRIGEKITLRRIKRITGSLVTCYVHTNNKIGVLLALTGTDESLGKDIAMHIAATNPQAIAPEDVPSEVIDKEKELFCAQAAQSGKPPEIIEKMVQGRIRKFLAEISLVEQPFVKNPELTISNLLQKANARVTAFVRFEVGEGIEKHTVSFAEEVRQQAGV